MKISAALFLASVASTTVTAGASKTISGKKGIEKILRQSHRRIEEQNDEDQDGDGEEEEYAFLQNYNLKFVSCMPGERVINPENGDYEYGAVTLHLCPSSEGCDSDTENGCKKNYGSIVVSAETFVDAWFEDQRDNMEWDDNFNVEEYTQCSEYDKNGGEDGDDGAAGDDEYAQYAFYIGPECTEDGLDIRLALFEDDACQYESEHDFADVSDGWSLPYSDGGLATSNCIDCYAKDDDGNYGTREMCEQTYEFSPYKCETDMEYVSYYGANEQGCDYVASIAPVRSSGSTAGKVFGWLFFIILVAVAVGYVTWWRKKSKFLIRPIFLFVDGNADIDFMHHSSNQYFFFLRLRKLSQRTLHPLMDLCHKRLSIPNTTTRRYRIV